MQRKYRLVIVGVRRLELPTSTSRTWRAANCATPRVRKSNAKIEHFFESSTLNLNYFHFLMS